MADETGRVPEAAQRVEGRLTRLVANSLVAASAFPFAQDVEVEFTQSLHLLRFPRSPVRASPLPSRSSSSSLGAGVIHDGFLLLTTEASM